MRMNFSDKMMQEKPKAHCIIEDCDEPAKARGMCASHYNHFIYEKNKNKKITPVKERDCANLDCNNKLEKNQRKFCLSCHDKYNRFKRIRENNRTCKC